MYGQNVCVARGPGKLKNVAGVRILGIGEVDLWSCLGVGSLTQLPLKPETLNPKTETLKLDMLNPGYGFINKYNLSLYMYIYTYIHVFPINICNSWWFHLRFFFKPVKDKRTCFCHPQNAPRLKGWTVSMKGSTRSPGHQETRLDTLPKTHRTLGG